MREEHGISHSLHGLGQCALLRGDLAQAEKMLQEALRLRHRWGHRRHLSNTFDLLGKLRVVQGNIPQGVHLMGLARGMWREMGLMEIGVDEHMAAARTVLGDELMAQLLAEGETLSVEQALTMLDTLSLKHLPLKEMA